MIGFIRPWTSSSNMADYSIGETDSLVLKAYRGAGFSWGLAQEAGNAAAWLATHGLPAIDQFALLLSCTDGTASEGLTPVPDAAVWSGPSGLLCPIISGVTLAESNLQQINFNKGLVLNNVQQPLLLLPFIAQASLLLNTNLEMCAADFLVECVISGQGIAIKTNAADEAVQSEYRSDVKISASGTDVEAGVVTQQRGFGQPESIERLNELAHRTYVPATDASRNAGAGAGLLDND